MLAKLVDLITAIPELVPLFTSLINIVSSGKSKEDKIEIAKRSVLAAAARHSFLEALPGRK